MSMETELVQLPSGSPDTHLVVCTEGEDGDECGYTRWADGRPGDDPHTVETGHVVGVFRFEGELARRAPSRPVTVRRSRERSERPRHRFVATSADGVTRCDVPDCSVEMSLNESGNRRYRTAPTAAWTYVPIKCQPKAVAL